MPTDSDNVARPLDVRLNVVLVEAAGRDADRRALGRRLAKDVRLVVADRGRVDAADDSAELQMARSQPLSRPSTAM